MSEAVSVSINTPGYEAREADFLAYKDTLPKEPSGDVKKEYCVGCFEKSDWEFIHQELMKDGSLEDNIPTDKCDCINDCLQSDVRGVYLLTETEASELKANPKVDYVHVNTAAYLGTYQLNPEGLADTTIAYRYPSTVKHQMEVTNSGGGIAENWNSDKLNRCSSQLYRGKEKKNPWVTVGNSQNVFNDRIQQYGTGIDVDIIVCDQDMWFGHMEFINPNRINLNNIKTSTADGQVSDVSSTTAAPSNYIGGNVLGSGFSSSATDGICDVLDLVLDAPYYIDKEWFEASPETRLTTRWDGTTVPVESVAKEWWSDSSKRSSAFVNAGTVSSSALSNYTRAVSNGSHTAYKTGSGFHGTPCASQAYGRQYGWAYNANKWFLNLYGTNGVYWENGFDMQKIFHQNKPNRSSDNTKNPTVSSNSWALRFRLTNTSGYYYYRQGDTGSGGVEFTSWNYTGGSSGSAGGPAPRFMTHHNQSYISWEPQSGADLTAGNELISSGVIFVASAGNTRQKFVDGSHPDFNNYVSASNGTPLSSSTFTFNNITYATTLNRPGFPNGIGKTGSGASTRYGTIQVGALDNVLQSGKERIVTYSNMGMGIDCYSTAENSLASVDNRWMWSKQNRYDAAYEHAAQFSLFSPDAEFGGTSSSCPIAAGLIATKLQYNRTWTYTSVKNWLATKVGEQNTSDFYTGTECTSPNDINWTDLNNLHGGPAIVPFDTPEGVDTTNPTLSSSVPANGATEIAINSNIVLNFSEGVTTQSGNIVIYKASDDSVIETISVTSGQVTGSGTSQITINPSSDLSLNTTYYIQIASTAFDDAAGNSYAGITGVQELEFATKYITPDLKIKFSGNLSLSGILL